MWNANDRNPSGNRDCDTSTGTAGHKAELDEAVETINVGKDT